MRRRKPPRTIPPLPSYDVRLLVALRVVEFLLPRLNVDVGIGHLAEINLWAGHAQTGHRALDRHVAQQERGQPFRRESIDRIHGDAVAVSVDQLIVDPVAAALGELIDIQLARGEHYLASRAVNVIAINIDIGEIVVGADFLNLTQRVLQCAPVPQPDVLKRSLIVRRVSRLDSRIRGKLALRDSVQSVGLARQVGVEDNVGLLANQLVRFNYKAADVPGDCLNRQITDRGRNNRAQPASARVAISRRSTLRSRRQEPGPRKG